MLAGCRVSHLESAEVSQALLLAVFHYAVIRGAMLLTRCCQQPVSCQVTSICSKILTWLGCNKHSPVVWWRHLHDVHCIIDASIKSHTIYVFCCLLCNAAEPLCSHART